MSKGQPYFDSRLASSDVEVVLGNVCKNCGNDRLFRKKFDQRDPGSLFPWIRVSQVYCFRCENDRRGNEISQRAFEERKQKLLDDRLTRSDYYLKLAGVPKVNRGFSWKDFNLPGKKDEAAAVREVALGEHDSKTSVFIWGTPGTGKTTLAGLFLLERLLKGEGWFPSSEVNGPAPYGLHMERWDNLCTRFRKTAYHDSVPEEDVFESLHQVQVLVIDELSVSPRPSDWESRILLELVHYRWANKKSLVITANDVESLEAYAQGRVASRIAHFCVMVKLGGKDFRFGP